MKVIQIILITLVLSLCGYFFQNVSYANEYPISNTESSNSDLVDFGNNLIPIFTKFGCNAGACHGSAAGRGEFKLSLFGGNPKADYNAIVRQLSGRRINLMHPEQSLVILKPTVQTSHGGGQVLFEDGEAIQLLRKWVEQGALYQNLRQLERVEISPEKKVITNLENPIQLHAKAYYSNGRTEDVTRWTVFTPEDTSAIEIDASTAIAKLNRPGRHIILARYLTEVVPIELIAPLNDVNINNKQQTSEAPRLPTSTDTIIDYEIHKLLSILRLPISGTIDDATFLRRVTLDLTGRIPTTDAVKAFTAENSRKKIESLVDRLLKSNEFNEYWTLHFAKLLRIGAKERNTQGSYVYHQWLSNQIRDGVGYDKIARAVILATGDTHEIGPANFLPYC